MSSELYIIYAVATIAIINYITRVTPFLFFEKKQPSKTILIIRDYFPPIIMTILIFYSLKHIDFNSSPYGFNEVASVLVTFLLHIFFKNYLISIFVGTITYMILVQGVV